MSLNVRTDCFLNLTTAERIDLFKRRQGLRIDNVFRTYFGWMVLPIGLLGVVLVTLNIITACKAIKARAVSRKCYTLLLNRAVGDLLSCIVALIVCAYVLLWREIKMYDIFLCSLLTARQMPMRNLSIRDMVILMESFFTGSFWSAMISYVALSVLKLFAVWRPFHYRKWFTMKRCINLVILSWIMFILMISYTLGISALVKVPALNEWSGCRMETCLRDMYRSRNLFTITVYFFTLFVFLVTVLLIRRAQNFMNTFKKKDSNRSDGGRRIRFPLWKLALNVATFAGFYIFYVIWCVGLQVNRDQCFFQRNYPEMMRILAFVRFTLLLRILVDPVLSFVTDVQLRRTFLTWIGVNGKLGSSRVFQKATTSDTSIGDNPIERGSRSQTVSTTNSNLPSTLKF